ncbi:uncharacterized protein LOC128484361 [Spea bombifrons]|uniref:uncharacterized protein LOC128484361 n=1 Tax=Spea bombifrons TaxID=233779 RepID=UPI00234963EE|nr:uncharacterized protein LOC128484361 [Spea bombifrons]
MVTSGKDGSVKQWNCTPNSVSCVKTLKHSGSDSSKDEVSDCSYAQLHNVWYIISVGCDRQINIFPVRVQLDAVIPEEHYPQCTSINNMRNDHAVGSFCVASMPPNLVATSSYNGEIIVWNLESGHILCHLNVSECEELENGTDNLIVNKVEFIRSRTEQKDKSAVLVASGPRVLHSWRAHLRDITRVVAVAEHKMVITSSVDSTVKLWSMRGEHIGTFGQTKPWSIKRMAFSKDQNCDTSTDSRGQPPPPELVSKQDQDCRQEVDRNLCVPLEAENQTAFGVSVPLDDKDIAEELKNRALNLKNRVKTTKLKQADLQQACGRLNAYKSLQICDLMTLSTTIKKPNPAAELNDPYDLTF